jgi:methionyl-tRNA formyltransferase
MSKSGRLILMGTGPFAVPSFKQIAASDYEIALVVTRPIVVSKSRRGPPSSPVRDWAISQGIDLIDPPSINDAAIIETLRSLSVDLAVVCDYGQILSAEALSAFRLGGLNLHGSLLPKYRGAAPVQWSVLNGDPITGVSVLHMTPRLDGGPIVATAQTEILPDETSGDLELRLSQLGVAPTLDAIVKVLAWDGQSALGQPQDSNQKSKAPRLEKDDGAIDWNRSATEIDCHVRGMQPWPVAFTYFKPRIDKPEIRLAILSLRITDEPSDDRHSGEIRMDNGLYVSTSDRWVEVTQLQPAGKKPMTGHEFARGHRPPEGSRLFSM